MSKTQKTIQTRNKLASLFCSYAFTASDWEPTTEGDYTELLDCIDDILEKFVTSLDAYSFDVVDD